MTYKVRPSIKTTVGDTGKKGVTDNHSQKNQKKRGMPCPYSKVGCTLGKHPEKKSMWVGGGPLKKILARGKKDLRQ